MAGLRTVFPPLRNRRFFDGDPNTSDRPQRPPVYELPSPSPKEILQVKDILLKKLPLEIVETVIEHAEYWACITVSTGGRTTTVGGYQTPEDVLILRTFPLCYYPTTGDSNSHTIPHEDYLVKRNVPHAIEPSDAVQLTTSNLLSQWKHDSSPRIESPIRKVVFTLKSRDQGWGSDRRAHHGIYEHAWSWFDVGLERFQAVDVDKCTPECAFPEGFIEQFRLESGDGPQKNPTSIACDFLPTHPAVTKDQASAAEYKYDHPWRPTGTRLQSNRTANAEVMEHIITWSYDDCIDPNSSSGEQLEREGRGSWTGNGDFVRSLKLGDIITVWARCRFAGWTNNVEDVKIDVYWVV